MNELATRQHVSERYLSIRYNRLLIPFAGQEVMYFVSFRKFSAGHVSKGKGNRENDVPKSDAVGGPSTYCSQELLSCSLRCPASCTKPSLSSRSRAAASRERHIGTAFVLRHSTASAPTKMSASSNGRIRDIASFELQIMVLEGVGAGRDSAHWRPRSPIAPARGTQALAQEQPGAPSAHRSNTDID
jgi:hypothetical protein